MTITNPNLIFYTCISKGTTILAEFNSRDADLGALAAKCLEKTPPLHTTFSHTVRKTTYTFLIDGPFVYFAISDENFENLDALAFLRSVKEAFDEIITIEDVKAQDNLNSHCFQGDFNPIFHQLLASPEEDLEGPHSQRQVFNHDHSGSLDSPRGKRIVSAPLLGGDTTKSLKKKKKKKFIAETNGDGKDGSTQNKVDVSDDTVVLTRDFAISMGKNGLFSSDLTHQKAKRAWKKRVWVVLSLDLIVCTILFGVWLWICRGFKCIDG